MSNKQATTEPLARELANELMRAIDQVISKGPGSVMGGFGLEAFRFDADVCPEEGWMRIKITVRPVDRG